MKTRLLLLLALVGLGLVAVPSPADAVAHWSYSASSGATYIKLADGTVTSDLTAQSSVTGGPQSRSSHNHTAAASAGPLVRTGVAETSATATRTDTATTLTSTARTADVKLLGGLITIDAVSTKVTTVGHDSGTSTHSANTQLAGVHIAGVKLPVRIPHNYAVRIPGVATVSLNYSIHGNQHGTVGTMGWAVGVTLLKPRRDLPAGATIMINPVTQFLVDTPPSTGAKLNGAAYGTMVAANASQISVKSDPTAFIGTPYGSSNGRTLRNTTAGVNVPGVLTTDGVASTSTSNKDTKGNADIRNTNELAKVRLLGGLVKADAIKVVAHGRVQDGKWTSGLKMTTVNLVVAGHKIPLNVGPNTTLNLAGVGRLVLNRQVKNPLQRVNQIDAVQLTLSTAQAGLKAGAVIRIGVAATQIS